MNRLNDTALIDLAVKEGNGDAFRALLSRHYGLIYKLAFKWTGRKHEAEDIAQEVCLKLAKKLPEFGGKSAFTSWLYQVTLNTMRDMARKAKTDRAREQIFVEDSALNPAADDSPEKALLQKQALARFVALPDEMKEAVLLVVSEGITHREAAKILGCAESTISWRIMRAKQLLMDERA